MKIDLPFVINEEPKLEDFSDKEKPYLWFRIAHRVYMKTRCAEAQNWRCPLCEVEMIPEPKKRNSATLEHVIPLSLNGLDEWINYAATCNRCNNKAGNDIDRERFECYSILCT